MAGSESGTTEQSAADGSRPAILLVDRNEPAGKWASALEKQGWSVLRAQKQGEVLQLLRSRPVDIVVAPQRGTASNHIKFLQKLSRISPATKKIVVTERDEPEALLMYTNRAGVDFLLSRPVNVHQLARAIRQVWEARQFERASYLKLSENGNLFAELEAYKAQLEAEMRESSGQLSKSNRELRKALRDIADKNKALMVLNESLKIQSTTDLLTGLYNRREFLNRIRTEWGRFKRYGRPLSLIMLDIDRFKRVNDTYGHDCGDSVLRSLGHLIRNHRRAQDISCRYGGEEFVVLLTETPMELAYHVAEGLRQLIADEDFRYHELHMKVHVSLGISGAMEQGPRNVESFINLADKAMYRAKREGRNRTVILDPSDERVILRKSGNSSSPRERAAASGT